MHAALPAIAVVIVTYNSASNLGTCLDSLPAGFEDVRLVEVVVADNASSDDSVKIARAVRDIPVRVVEMPGNEGYAAGINAAVGALPLESLDAVLILNPDITVDRGAVAPLAASLTGGRGVIVPQLRNTDGTLQPSLRRRPTLVRAVVEAVIGGRRAAQLGIGELVVDPHRYAEPGIASWATGAALLLSVPMIRDIGPWDESFLLYSEETEYALRAADRGWSLWYEPTSVMHHVSGDAYAVNPMLYALMVVNRVRLFQARNSWLSGQLYQAVVTFGELLRAVAGRHGSRAAVAALLIPARRMRSLPGSVRHADV